MQLLRAFLQSLKSRERHITFGLSTTIADWLPVNCSCKKMMQCANDIRIYLNILELMHKRRDVGFLRGLCLTYLLQFAGKYGLFCLFLSPVDISLVWVTVACGLFSLYLDLS